jgi:hypothetical protein
MVDEWGEPYVEAQYWGPLTLADVKRVSLAPWSPLSADAMQRLEDAGIEVQDHG